MIVYETKFIIRPNLTCAIKAMKIWKIRSVRSSHDQSGDHRKVKKPIHSHLQNVLSRGRFRPNCMK